MAKRSEALAWTQRTVEPDQYLSVIESSNFDRDDRSWDAGRFPGFGYAAVAMYLYAHQRMIHDNHYWLAVKHLRSPANLATRVPRGLARAADDFYPAVAAEAVIRQSNSEQVARQLDAGRAALAGLREPLSARTETFTRLADWESQRGVSEPWLDIALTGIAVVIGIIAEPWCGLCFRAQPHDESLPVR